MTSALSAPNYGVFKAQLRGNLIQPGDAGYDEAHQWGCAPSGERRHGIQLPNDEVGCGDRRRGPGSGKQGDDHQFGSGILGRRAPLCGPWGNFLMEEGTARVEATYGANYARLQAIKAKYDPGNLFRVNQNIAPRA
jgi:hypothetical protein